MDAEQIHPWVKDPREKRENICTERRSISEDLDRMLADEDGLPSMEERASAKMPRMLAGYDPVRVASSLHWACGEEYGWAR